MKIRNFEFNKKNAGWTALFALSLLLFFQNCGDVAVNSFESRLPPELVVKGDSITGTFCHADTVANSSVYRLSNFYIVNLTSHKFNGDLYSDNDLDGIVDKDEDYSADATVEISPTDTDEDGLPDFVEKLKGLNPNNNDADKDGVDLDGIINRRELQLGTDPSFTGDESVIDYTVRNVESAAGCGAGQPVYKFGINKIMLTYTKKFTDTLNSDPYSLSHNDYENLILVLAKLSPDDMTKASVFVAKIFSLNAMNPENKTFNPPDFYVLGNAVDACPECNQGGSGTIYNKIFSSGKHSCAISDKNAAICWGDNSYGQLGDGTSAARVAPIKIKLTEQILTMALGPTHTCAITFGQDVYCWGSNSFGQLGNGTTNDSLTPLKVDLGAGLKANHIMAGRSHTCAILDNNTMKCWGRNDVYQLANGNNIGSLLPVASILPTMSFPITHTSAALNNNCITSNNGAAYCWGGINGCIQNAVSQVPSQCTNLTSTTLPSEGIRLTSSWQMVVTNGYANSGFDKTALGNLTCWSRSIFGGYNFGFGCGDQSDGGAQSDPPVPSTEYTVSVLRLNKVVMGSKHSCSIWSRLGAGGALTKVLDCWGEDTLGALAQPPSPTGYNITPNTVSEIKEPKDVSAGDGFSCAIDKDGAIWCWGLNSFGQLGSGDIVNNHVPNKIKNQ